MSEEEEQYEKIYFTFPVAIEWIIEYGKIPFSFADQMINTKIYNVPGFPWFKYDISFSKTLIPENFVFQFWRDVLNKDQCEWESNLCLTINNGEPKKILQKFKEHNLLLYEGPIEKSDLITLRINGTITVHEISMPDEHDACIPSSFENRKLKEPKDFVIKVENQEIEVHKKVLQQYSPVFSAMFENGWKEASEGRVVIPEFPLEIVETAVGLCYGEWIYGYIENPELILLYHFADKYDMDELKHTIKQVIWLTPNNICEYANLFHAENCLTFVSHCIDRLIVYFQFSYPVKNLETLNNDIKLQFFNQASISQALKKEFNPDYHKNHNNEDYKRALPFL